jgi:acetyl esterase/lipase
VKPLLRVEVGVVALAEVVRTLLRRLAHGPRRPGWTLRTELAQSVMRAVLMHSKRRGVAWLRAAQDALPANVPLAGQVEFRAERLGGVACEWCAPRGRTPERTIVYLHGGGFVVGSLAAYRDLVSRLALGADARVLAVDYRLAPEHPFPAQQLDCLAATRTVLAQADPRRVAIAGDSAGASLTVATLCALRDAGEPRPAAAALICPWTEPLAAGGSMDAHAAFDFGDRALLAGWAEAAIGAGDPADPRFTVANAKLAGLPPLLIQIGSVELLYDQALRFVERARAGARVEHVDAAVAVVVARSARSARGLPARREDRIDAARIHEAVRVDVAAALRGHHQRVVDRPGQVIARGGEVPVAGDTDAVAAGGERVRRVREEARAAVVVARGRERAEAEQDEPGVVQLGGWARERARAQVEERHRHVLARGQLDRAPVHVAGRERPAQPGAARRQHVSRRRVVVRRPRLAARGGPGRHGQHQAVGDGAAAALEMATRVGEVAETGRAGRGRARERERLLEPLRGDRLVAVALARDAGLHHRDAHARCGIDRLGEAEGAVAEARRRRGGGRCDTESHAPAWASRRAVSRPASAAFAEATSHAIPHGPARSASCAKAVPCCE